MLSFCGTLGGVVELGRIGGHAIGESVVFDIFDVIVADRDTTGVVVLVNVSMWLRNLVRKSWRRFMWQ